MTDVVLCTGGLIQPDAIPFVDTDPPLLASAGFGLSSAGRSIGAAGPAVVADWSTLAASYEAPEAPQLLGVLDPVEQTTRDVGLTLIRAGDLIQEFAENIAAPRRRLRQLRDEAEAFVASTREGFTVDIHDRDHPAWEAGIFSYMVTDFVDMEPAVVPWNKHQPSIERNSELLSEVNAQVALVDQARVECVNGLRALSDVRRCSVEEIAVSAEQLDDEGVDLPWGTQTLGDRSCYESFGDGIAMSFIGGLNGIGALMAIDATSETFEESLFQWELASEAWSGLAQSLGAVIYSSATQEPLRRAIGINPEWSKQADDWALGWREQVSEGVIGSPEEWETNPSRAAGALSLEIGSAVTGGMGASVLKHADVASFIGRLDFPEFAKPFYLDSFGSRYGARLWNEIALSLPADQRQALRDYSMEPPHYPSYVDINGQLRRGVGISTYVKATVDAMDLALRARPVPEAIIVRRGTDLGHFSKDPKSLVGETFIEPGFLSTSLGHAAFNDRDSVMHLTVPAGTPAIYMEKLSAFGGSERELLLARGLKIEIRKVKFRDGQWQLYGEVMR